MLYARNKPVGIDIPIAGFQKFLYSQVKAAWNITDDVKYDCYDRAYRDLTDKGYVPRFILPNSQGALEYKTLFFDPELNWAMSFFHMAGTTQVISNRTSLNKCSLIFAVNLGTPASAKGPAVLTVKPNITDHRPDEEVRNDIENICYVPRFNFNLTGVEIDFDQVFKEYRGFLNSDNEAFQNFQMLHVFRINFDLIYDSLDTYNC